MFDNSDLDSIRSSISSCEKQFLEGTGKDTKFLNKGYSHLKTIIDKDYSKFDSNLLALYYASKSTDVCRQLSEGYKFLAYSTEKYDDFIRAAFWFRLLYVTEHSSYLDDFDAMIFKAKNLQN